MPNLLCIYNVFETVSELKFGRKLGTKFGIFSFLTTNLLIRVREIIRCFLSYKTILAQEVLSILQNLIVHFQIQTKIRIFRQWTVILHHWIQSGHACSLFPWACVFCTVGFCSWWSTLVIVIYFLFRFPPNECSDSIFSSGLFEPLDKS